MQSFGFRVVPSDDGDSKVPVAVAGQIMVDVQNLLTDIGENMVRMELRLQNGVPERLSRLFRLEIGGGSGGSLGADPSEAGQDLMDDALNTLCSTLDFLGKGVVGTWLQDNFPDAPARRDIATDVLTLYRHLEGRTLVYGPPGQERRFNRVDEARLAEVAGEDVGTYEGAMIGVISRDPVRKNRWNISNGPKAVPISFSSNIVASDIPSFAEAGPVIVTGTVVRGPDGGISEFRNAIGCYSFPEVKFHRVISSEGDRVLLVPVVGVPGYDAQKGVWSLRCEMLGIDERKPSWDECVASFHEYFMFLWDTYAKGDGDFEGEEKEIRDLLLSMVPVTAD